MAYEDSNNSREDRDVNFADKPMNEIGGDLMNWVNEYYLYIRDAGYLDIWRSLYNQYYKGYYTRGRPESRGEAGELTKVSVNHFRNMCLHVVNMVTAQRPSFDPRAANSDYKSQAQTILAKGILDYYMRNGGLEDKLKDAAETAFLFGEGFIITEWDSTKGEEVAPEDLDDKDNKEIKKSGDIIFKNATPLDVIRDYNVMSYDDCQWHIVRTFENKFDLAKQFPEFEEDIKGMTYQRDTDRDLYVWMKQRNTSDMIQVFTFYHKQSNILPQGRVVKFLDAEKVLTDSTLIGGDYPLKRIATSEMKDTPFGYSATFDMLQLQKNIDSLSSSITTNQEMFGTQMLSVEAGSGQDVTDFGGMKFHIRQPGTMPPEPLQLTKTAPEIFDYLNTVEGNMEKLAGVNSVVRGDPQASLESGSALALVKQSALEFNNAFEQSYNKTIEDQGSSIIKLTQAFATTPRIISLAGKSGKWYLEEYKGEDIDKIERVIVDSGNPLAKTTAGKIQIADSLMDRGMIKTMEQYTMVLTVGRLDPITEGDQSELMFIKDENEQLSNGVELEAAWTDAHNIHIREHKVVMASIDARQDEGLMNATLKHLEQHLQFLRETDPSQLMAIGEQPMQPPMPPPPPGGEGAIDPAILANGANMAAQEQPNLPEQPLPAQAPEMQ